MLTVANAVFAELQADYPNRVFLVYDSVKEADQLFFAAGRERLQTEAVFVYSVDADLRGMAQTSPSTGIANFTGIFSIATNYESHFWTGNAICVALDCNSIALRTIYSLFGDNCSNRITGVRMLL